MDMDNDLYPFSQMRVTVTIAKSILFIYKTRKYIRKS